LEKKIREVDHKTKQKAKFMNSVCLGAAGFTHLFFKQICFLYSPIQTINLANKM